MSDRPASLGMYDHPAVSDANDALWSAIAERLRHVGVERVPAALDRGRPLEQIWSDPDLLLAQTCGYPLMTRWHGRLRYVATPCYRAEGCDGEAHSSRIVVRRDDPAASLAALRGARAALNDVGSNSGMNLFRAAIADHADGAPFFSAVIETGSHRESAHHVASGLADAAAIDAVTFALLERHEPDLIDGLRTLAWSNVVPGLPLVTSLRTSPREIALLRRTLREVTQDSALDSTRDALMLDGFETVHLARYQRILAIERSAARLGYPTLA
jgi:ABC-type phosphate/phosphonate transport system substrate-binding protein